MTSLKDTLDQLTARYNVPSFADRDPISFPKRFTDQRDIEISAFLTSVISWGRRQMILNNAERLHGMLDHRPYRFVMEGDIDSITDDNIHRTFFGRHLRYALRGLREIYARHDSLEAFAADKDVQHHPSPAWRLAEEINAVFCQANNNCGESLSGASRCLPADSDKSALKRFNMALRWLVRNDGIVDIGCWSLLKPADLYIPLDVHSGNTARALGLLNRKANDRRAVEELTSALRQMRPDDPVAYDFALFGAGEEGIALHLD